jgi:hypothetical protein
MLPPPEVLLPFLRSLCPPPLIYIHLEPRAAVLLINIFQNCHDLGMVTPFTGNTYIDLLQA